jgi:hypothetical protein
MRLSKPKTHSSVVRLRWVFGVAAIAQTCLLGQGIAAEYYKVPA